MFSFRRIRSRVLTQFLPAFVSKIREGPYLKYEMWRDRVSELQRMSPPAHVHKQNQKTMEDNLPFHNTALLYYNKWTYDKTALSNRIHTWEESINYHQFIRSASNGTTLLVAYSVHSKPLTRKENWVLFSLKYFWGSGSNALITKQVVCKVQKVFEP